jgi:hypothetical protein
MDVGSLTTLESFACTMLKRRMVINLDRLAPCVITAQDERQYGGNSGRNLRVTSGRIKHRARKERNGDTDRLLGRSSLKEGEMCYISPKQKLWSQRNSLC